MKLQKKICDKCNQEILEKKTDWFDELGIDFFILFAPTILIIGLLFMGTLDGKYQTREEYSLGANKSMHMIANIGYEKIIMKFYDIGKENPKEFTYVWYLTLLIWFIFPIYSIGRYFYKRMKGGNKKW